MVFLGWVGVLVFYIYFVLLAVCVDNTHLALLMSPTLFIYSSESFGADWEPKEPSLFIELNQKNQFFEKS